MGELLALADSDAQQRWDTLRLAYTGWWVGSGAQWTAAMVCVQEPGGDRLDGPVLPPEQ